MLNQFKGFIGYSEEEFKEIWEKALFVVDTNILINFYKYTSKDSTKSLLDILKKLKVANRLWVPHQVALEYFFNCEKNMFKQKEGYQLLSKELLKLKTDAQKTLESVKSKHPYIMTEKFKFFIDNLENSNQIVKENIEKEIKNLPDSKETQQFLLELLDDIVGEPFSQQKIDGIEKLGEERYSHKVPPGFEDKKDNGKLEFRTYGDFRYQRLYGDLIVWFQMIERASLEDSTTPIIFITEDKKEDWWEIDKGQVKRPLPQLIQEFQNKTNQKFYMYRTDSFVKNAMKFLKADVTEEQYLQVTDEINNIRKLKMEKDKENSFNEDMELVLEYLSLDQQRNYFDIRVKAHKSSLEETLLQYQKAEQWAIDTALPKVKRHYKNIAKILKEINEGSYFKAVKIYNDMKRNGDMRIWVLLEHISKMENEIAFSYVVDTEE